MPIPDLVSLDNFGSENGFIKIEKDSLQGGTTSFMLFSTGYQLEKVGSMMGGFS